MSALFSFSFPEIPVASMHAHFQFHAVSLAKIRLQVVAKIERLEETRVIPYAHGLYHWRLIGFSYPSMLPKQISAQGHSKRELLIVDLMMKRSCKNMLAVLVFLLDATLLLYHCRPFSISSKRILQAKTGRMDLIVPHHRHDATAPHCMKGHLAIATIRVVIWHIIAAQQPFLIHGTEAYRGIDIKIQIRRKLFPSERTQTRQALGVCQSFI